MSYPEALTYEEARGFADFIRERVLRYSEHENPELPRLYSGRYNMPTTYFVTK